MSRSYADPIRIVAGDPGEQGEPTPPQGFRWRGRRYRVTVVLARWIEADSWWRAARPVDGVVWRVEASRGGSVGVFDLRQDEGTQQWFLVRTFD